MTMSYDSCIDEEFLVQWKLSKPQLRAPIVLELDQSQKILFTN